MIKMKYYKLTNYQNPTLGMMKKSPSTLETFSLCKILSWQLSVISIQVCVLSRWCFPALFRVNLLTFHKKIILKKIVTSGRRRRSTLYFFKGDKDWFLNYLNFQNCTNCTHNIAKGTHFSSEPINVMCFYAKTLSRLLYH